MDKKEITLAYFAGLLPNLRLIKKKYCWALHDNKEYFSGKLPR